MKRIISLLPGVLALLLTACSGPAAQPKPVSSEAQTAASSEVVEIPDAPQKLNPGCRIDIPYPLQMTGKSDATDFTRWTAADLDGREVTQEVLKGSRLTVVSAWSSGCGSCIEDLASLQAIYEHYDRADVNVIGVVASAQNPDGSLRDGEIEIVRQLQGMTGASFMQLLPSDDLIAIKLHDVDIVPETFLLDSGGSLVGETLTGGRTTEEFLAYVEDGLQQLKKERVSE